MKYSKAFKEKAVKKVLQMKETQSMLTIAKELNVSKATLYIWVNSTSNTKATDGNISLFPKTPNPKRELQYE